MALRIGHARISENGTSGWDGKAKAGNQTGKELTISNWYDGSWDCVLRAKSPTIAEKSASGCEKMVKNLNIGYDQSQRNTLHTVLVNNKYNIDNINTLCETDCSAFMTVCAIYAGVNELEYKDNAPRTANMEIAFGKTGKYHVLKEKKFLNSTNYLMRGDILVKAGKHTVMVLDNGKNYTEVFKGNKGSYVTLVQSKLASKGYTVGTIDGDCGSKTDAAIRAFQSDNGLVVDGHVGPATYKVLN